MKVPNDAHNPAKLARKIQTDTSPFPANKPQNCPQQSFDAGVPD